MAMATFNKFHCFVEDMIKGVHNLTTSASGTLKIALTNVAPVATNSLLGTHITQIDYTNVITTPNANRVIGNPTEVAQTLGVLRLNLPDMTITAGPAAIPQFQYVVLYNDTPSAPLDPLIGWIDYGAPLDLGIGEALVVDFHATLGLFTIQ
jgi:hypothetical protein